MDALIDVQAVAAEAFAALDAGRQIEPFSSRLSSFNLDDAYHVTVAVRKMREARGELSVGRKIGFTNPTVWTYAPMWGYVYNRTVHNLAEIGVTFSLMDLAEPRIEPEIVFRLAVAPTPAWMREHCLRASTGLRTVLKSCNRSLRIFFYDLSREPLQYLIGSHFTFHL